MSDQSEEEILGTESEELALFDTPEEKAVAARMLPVIAAKANEQAEANKLRELNAIVEQLKDQNKKDFDAELEKLRKSMTPPTTEELQAVLNQEYATFTVKAGGKEFTIGELCIDAEERVLSKVKAVLGELLTQVSRVDWSNSMTQLDRVTKIVELVPAALNTLSECVAVFLDPWGTDKDITGAWVRKTMGMSRMVAIMDAQITASRYRDFLSHVSRFMPGSMIG